MRPEAPFIIPKGVLSLDNKTAAVTMRNITKRFGPTLANDKVWLDIYRGEILALLGENGSGKTTLMNMLSGIYFPDEGEIAIDGRPVVIRSPKDAFDLGIGMIHQHFKLVDVLTAAENIVLGLPGKLDLKAASKKIREICDLYGFEVDPNQLFAVLRNMRDDGKAIVIITHKMHEVEALSDRVAILRHGQFIGDMPTKMTNAQEMTNMMVGHPVTLNIDRPEPKDPKPRIEVRGLTVRSMDGILKLDDVSFTANSGEILGIAGISGCGQKELLEAIAGLQPVEAGSISYIEDDGTREELIGKDPLSIAEMGVSLSFVPEDRLGMGLVANMDLSDNMMLRSFRRGRSLFTDRVSPKKLAETVVQELEVVTPGVTTPVRRLSGGNVQKVLVGREIASAPTVLLTAYAVRGLDINSSYTIYDLINQQKAKGVAVLYVGEDLDVLLELADRILVLCGGKVSGIVPGRGATKRDVGLMMTKLGGKADE